MVLWKEYIENNINKAVDVDLDILRFSIVAVKGKSISEYFTFKDKKTLVEFLKDVVLPSIALSMFFEDNKDPSIYLWNKEEVTEFLEGNGGILYSGILKSYTEAYEYLENILKKELDKEILIELVNYLEKKFDAYNLVFLNLSYGETTDDYLENMIRSYKDSNLLDILEKDLKVVGLNIEKLNDIIENIYQYEEGIRENILDKLL